MAEDCAAYRKAFVAYCITATVVLSMLYYKSFDTSNAVFANDGPLGLMKADTTNTQLPFEPRWNDLEWLGVPNIYVPPSFTVLFTYVVGPEFFARFYAPISCLILGIAMFGFLRKLRLVPFACWFGGMAACLNSNFFSYAAWGLGTLNICTAAFLFAISYITMRK